MDVTIIMATCQRAKPLAATLDSLQRVEAPGGLKVELLVIENGSKDATEGVVQSIKANGIEFRYVYEPLQGKSRALNLGLRQARGEILVFADDDLRFARDWLARLCQPIVQGKARAAVGRISLPPHLLRPWMGRYHLGWLGAIPYATPTSPDEAAGANFACHRDVLERVPSFDVELGGGGLGNCEDSLFSRQIIEAGFPIVGTPDAEVQHYCHADKLVYKNWTQAARAAGRSRAYLKYHWLHEDIRNPWLRCWYFRAKLAVRKACSPRKALDDEGIPAWELSYLNDLSEAAHFIIERRRPRNYRKRGLVKLHGQK